MEKRVCTKERQQHYLLVSLVSLAPLSISVTKFWKGFRNMVYATNFLNSILSKTKSIVEENRSIKVLRIMLFSLLYSSKTVTELTNTSLSFWLPRLNFFLRMSVCETWYQTHFKYTCISFRGVHRKVLIISWLH